MLVSWLLALLVLTGALSATPVKRATTITAADILRIDPSTSSCANAPAAGECRTAAQAAPFISISFTNFGIETFHAQAALLSVMLYESGTFKYSKNHYPGVAGQGTRNMQSPAYNLQYAEYLSEVCANCGLKVEQVQQVQSDLAALLALVNTDEWSFGSAAWFLATQCSHDVRQGLAQGTMTGWHNYLQQCLRTDVNEEKDQIWKAAMALKAW